MLRTTSTELVRRSPFGVTTHHLALFESEFNFRTPHSATFRLASAFVLQWDCVIVLYTEHKVCIRKKTLI